MERPAGMTALRGTANGWGYDFTGTYVLGAYAAVTAAAEAGGVDEAAVKADARRLVLQAKVGASLLDEYWEGS